MLKFESAAFIEQALFWSFSKGSGGKIKPQDTAKFQSNENKKGKVKSKF